MKPPTIIFGIDSKKISHFTSIELVQVINDHHQFVISVPHSAVESPLAYTLENAQGWLGKVVHIVLEEKNNFLGVVTNIDFDQEMGHSGNQIIVSGYSKTILLESGEKMYSWEDSTLKDVVKEVIKNGAGEQLQNDINPEYTGKMEYQTQYLETDFQFIQRVAKQYNEWLYYDGEKLVFGKPKSFDDPIGLTYNSDISKLKISVQAVPNKFSAFTYNETNDKRYTAKSKDTVSGLPKLGNEAFEASKEVFTTAAFTHDLINAADDLALESFLKKKQESAAANTTYISASTKNSKLKVGSIVNIQSKILENTSIMKQEVGTYIITEITHHATHLGEYQNNFRAIPSKVLCLPEPDVAYPMAQTQQAIVESNTDPKNKGRVRVQMLWQEGSSMKTLWLRVMSPDAGSSEKVGTNRGLVFIPDPGDHVMVHFRYGDPNRPFILGSVFNDKTGNGGGSGNNNKTIQTKSGNIIAFDDSKQSITITDGAGNSVALNGAGNISVTASESISLSTGASSLTLNADGSIDLAGKIVTITGQDSLDHSGKKIRISGSEEAVVTSPVKVDINSAAEVSMTGTAKASVSSSAITAIEGTIIKLN